MDDRFLVDRLRASLAGSAGRVDGGSAGAAAAVAVILRARSGGAEVLLIRRAVHQGDPWSGQMGLPGGHRDPGDARLLDTAIRETREEVSVELDRHAALLGILPRVVTRPEVGRSQLVVTPFVFELSQEVQLCPGREVQEAIWAPLAPMLRGELDSTYPLRRGGSVQQHPAFDVDGHLVWGLTHKMLVTLFGILDASFYARPPPNQMGDKPTGSR